MVNPESIERWASAIEKALPKLDVVRHHEEREKLKAVLSEMNRVLKPSEEDDEPYSRR